MKAAQLKTLLILLLVVIINSSIFSQEEKPKDELYLMHEDIVKVDKVDQYEKAGKELFDAFRKYGMEGSVKYVSKTDDNRYYFLSPISSYADLDNRSKHWANLAEKAGPETLSKIFSSMDETYVSHKDVIIKRSVDLSYMPENDRLKGEKPEFVRFANYYFKDGKMKDGLKLLKEYKNLMIEKKSDDGYNVWIFDIGEDYGRIAITRAAKDNVDYYQAANKRRDLNADEMKEMWPKFAATLKHIELDNGSALPEFIYMPAE